jgi:peptidoglycan/LPS O-acetylase OafA/YrhL
MNIRLSFLSKGRVNNLNLIRMLAAIGVLISHSFPLTLGRGTGDFISNLFGVKIGTSSPFINILSSFPVVLVFATFSWHIVEKPALCRKILGKVKS